MPRVRVTALRRESLAGGSVSAFPRLTFPFFLSAHVLKTVFLISLESITGSDRVITDLRNRLADRGWTAEVLQPMKLVAESPWLRRTGLAALLLRAPGKRLLAMAWVEWLLLRRAQRERNQFTVFSAVYPLWGPGIWWGRASGRLRYLYWIPDMMWRKAYVEDHRWRLFKRAARSGVAAADLILVPTASAHLDCLTFVPRKHHGKIRRLSSPIDEAFWNRLVAEPVPALAARRFIFHPAGLKPNKNTSRALDALAIADLPGATFVYIANAVNSGGQGGGAMPGEFAPPGGAQICAIASPSDGQMKWLYQHCAFVSVVSLEEGVGLPILEAQAFGKAVVTSCISAMPEVSGGRAVFVDPFRPTDIARGYREAWSAADGDRPLPRPPSRDLYGADLGREIDEVFRE